MLPSAAAEPGEPNPAAVVEPGRLSSSGVPISTRTWEQLGEAAHAAHRDSAKALLGW